MGFLSCQVSRCIIEPPIRYEVVDYKRCPLPLKILLRAAWAVEDLADRIFALSSPRRAVLCPARFYPSALVENLAIRLGYGREINPEPYRYTYVLEEGGPGTDGHSCNGGWQPGARNVLPHQGSLPDDTHVHHRHVLGSEDGSRGGGDVA